MTTEIQPGTEAVDGHQQDDRVYNIEVVDQSTEVEEGSIEEQTLVQRFQRGNSIMFSPALNSSSRGNAPNLE